jgi:hypothetical protein
MKRYLIAIIILMASSASAANFSWTNPPENVGKIDGTKVYRDAAASGAVATVGPTASSATVADPVDGKCHQYWARAYKGTIESGNSNVVTWCPAGVDPPAAPALPLAPGTFTITGTITVQ